MKSKNKWMWIMVGIIAMIIVWVISISFSYILTSLSVTSGSWINWKVFIYPLPLWAILMIVILYQVKFKKSSRTALASSKWMDNNQKNKKFKTYSWKEKPNPGFIIETKISSNKNDLKYKNTQVVGHSTVIGATRSGKTSLLINPNIQTLAKAEATIIISDPKGELFETHSKPLQDQGYEVLSLNLRRYEKSSYWNPLERIWNMWFKEKGDREMNIDDAIGTLSELTAVLFPSTKSENPIWIEGAKTIFQFMCIGMLELAPYDEKIKKEHFNVTNILANLNASTYKDIVSFANLLEQIGKSQGTISRALMIGGRNVRGAEDTVSGMVQNAVTHLSVYNDSKIKRIISSTDIVLDNSKKQAIFLIVPDEDKSKNAFISLFVSENYKQLIAEANNHKGNKLPRPIYFILDEFGNIPKIPNLDSMVTVSASRNIFFQFVLQNYQQIENVYGREIASTVLNNCAYEYYLLTSDHKTAEEISKKIGEEEIEAMSESSSDRGVGSTSTSVSKRTRRLIDANELTRLKMGEVILMSTRNQPIKTTLAPFWEFKDFTPGEMEIKPRKLKDYQVKHIYNFVSGDNEEEEGQSEELIDEQEMNSQSNDIQENDSKLSENDKLMDL